MSRKSLTIGLVGFGCVGQGLWEVLQQSPGLRTHIARICVKNPTKPRRLPAHFFTYSADELVNDPHIEIIVELIDDAEAAWELARKALLAGKSVVTANKKMVANHFEELRALQQQTGAALLYEAASCASIPVIRNLEEYYDNDLLESIEGIVNGSTNYILSSMEDGQLNFQEALSAAQAAGFAESNPQLDLSGADAANKLVLLLAHAFGVVVSPEEIPCRGITQLGPMAWRFAKEKGFQLRLLAEARRQGDTVAAAVWPAFVEQTHELAGVKREFNGLVMQSCFADRQFFLGKGAGAHPTASAVLSDLSALTYGYRYEYKKLRWRGRPKLSNDFEMAIWLGYASGKQPDCTSFRTIFSRYEGTEGAYLTGSIDWTLLQEQSWFNHPEYTIIRMPIPLGVLQNADLRAA